MLAALMAATALGVGGCKLFETNSSSSSGGGDTVDTEAPVITVTGVPTSCNVGDLVTLPAATATDTPICGMVRATMRPTIFRRLRYTRWPM